MLHLLRLHLIGLLGFGLLIVGTGVGLQMRSFEASLIPSSSRPEAHIGIEHEGPLAIRLELSTNAKSGLLSITHDSEEHVAVSLPEDWKRGEIRGATLSDVRVEEVTFGFRRFSLPPHAQVSFAIPVAPESVKIHNPSRSSLKVDLTLIDLLEDSVTYRTFLMQEVPQDLW